ncbi:MAG: aspartate carbamoyltransferase catalytic subunit [Deltaproteobacteria bacterium]|nr:aspartate carbamoyltransferase catalytic subunit [Deltaproteobacteria bacterium]
MGLNRKDILDIESLSPDEIRLILETSESFKEVLGRDIKKVPTLRGKTVINLFFEASTRTRTSFEIAAKRLSADTINISASASSVQKGETLSDTVKNIEAMNSDVIIIRHPASGAPHFIAKRLKASVINAGDGSHEHPSQALLDMLTIKEKKGGIEGLKVAIIGDIAHSRVARSNIHGLTKMGAKVVLYGPKTLVPKGIDKIIGKYCNTPLRVAESMEEALTDADVVMMLRIQLERQGQSLFPSVREYSRFFGLNGRNVSLAKEDAIIMHPGPMNRGVEISSEIADGARSVILDQVNNGIAVRMAMLYLLAGGHKEVVT